MIRASLVMAVLASPVFADKFCDSLEKLPETQTLALPTAPAVTCAKGLALGGASFIHCGWDFDLRAAKAREIFETLNTALATCPGVLVRRFSDLQVNHPDSYELRLFDRGETEISISLKDKGALQKTYIFLRMQTP